MQVLKKSTLKPPISKPTIKKPTMATSMPKLSIPKLGEILTANVSTLKTHIGKYLKKVKEGAEVIVLDRHMPVAKLVMFSSNDDGLIEIAPKTEWQQVFKKLMENNKKFQASSKKTKKSLHYLTEDRE